MQSGASSSITGYESECDLRRMSTPQRGEVMETMIDLTERFPMRFDLERMIEEIRSIEMEHWLAHYDRKISDGWNAIPLVSCHGSMDGPDAQRVGRVGQYRRTPIVEQLPYFRCILDTFACPQGRVRISKLLPGAVIRPHRDICREAAGLAFGQVRLHLPIITNDRAILRVGRNELNLRPGRLYYVDFTRLHSVINGGTEPRIHLILDLQVNDFLERVFPEPTRRERAGRFLLRNTMPLIWPFYRVHFALKQWLLTTPLT
jgi:hypothetical protein